MARPNSDAWDEYAREQRAVRRRELHEQSDVSGREALDFMLNAIAAGKAFTPDEARRSRLSSARRERAQEALRTQYAPSIDAELLYRRGPDPEVTALLATTILRLPEKSAQVLVLQAQGYRDHEVAIRVSISAAAVRKRLSRIGRDLAA